MSPWAFEIPVRKRSLNERLRRGGRKQRLGLEAPNYLVVGIRESVLEEKTVTPLRPGLIDALILAGLALRPPEPLSSRATRLWNDTLQPVVHPAPDVSVVRRTPQRLKINRIGCKPERNILGLSIFGNTKFCLDFHNFRD